MGMPTWFPIEFFNEDILLRIENHIGARVCVQVNLKKALVPKVQIIWYSQRVAYEGVHRIYFLCSQYSYRSETYPTKEISVEIVVPGDQVL